MHVVYCICIAQGRVLCGYVVLCMHFPLSLHYLVIVMATVRERELLQCALGKGPRVYISISFNLHFDISWRWVRYLYIMELTDVLSSYAKFVCH